MQDTIVTKIEPAIRRKALEAEVSVGWRAWRVKVCHWTKQSLIADRSCYKGTFYGIESHGCMQMAPNVDTCNLGCTYCWREPHSETLNKIDDDPYELYLESVKAHRRLLTGFGGNPKSNKKKFSQAHNPNHLAISLNGEPTLYSRLGEFLEVCHNHGTSTFLVTNGSLPKVIENLIRCLHNSMSLWMHQTKRYSTDYANLSLTRVPFTSWRRRWGCFLAWTQGRFVGTL